MADRAHLERLTKELIAAGKLIEAGWISLRIAAVPRDAPPIQLTEMRQAFFAGAHHVFNSIMVVLEPGEEPTDADLDRMDKINAELNAFLDDFKRKHGLDLPAKKRRPTRESSDHRGAYDKPPPVPADVEDDEPAAPHPDETVDPAYQNKMLAIMKTVDEFMNDDAKGDDRKVGVVLLVSPFGEQDGRVNYMSNGVNRRDMIAMFRELAARFEGQPEVSGRA
jgi:hypothetical protein